MPSFALARDFEAGVLDALDVESSGELSLYGWSRDPAAVPGFALVCDGVVVPRRDEYRLWRPDVAGALRSNAVDHGFAIVFHAPPALRCERIDIRLGAESLGSIWPGIVRLEPHYAQLFDADEVLHREDIYRYGPPMATADVQVVDLARSLPGPILDVGCGSGALIRALRASGVDAEGIELNRTEIVDSLLDDVRSFVKLHDGSFPLPYQSDRFGAVVCSEVLEHIADWRSAIAEIGRVAPRALVTVPDMSAIPALFPHHVVPWHLLESTHLNFFTRRSLETALTRSFRQIRFLRLGEYAVNGTRVFTSLAADCRR